MSTTRAKLEADIRDAMRAHNQQRLDALRFLKSRIQQVEVDERKTLDEAAVLEVVSRQVKERRDSIRAFAEGHRDDLVAKESAELAIVEEYLPPQLGREELLALIQGVIREVGAESLRDKGKVMGRLMPQVRGKADGTEVNNLVTELLEPGR